MNIADFEAELRDLVGQAEEDGLLPELIRDALIDQAKAIVVAIRLPDRS